MATLTLKIATLTSSLEVADANATRVLEAVFALYHHAQQRDEEGSTIATTYTPKERLDWIVKTLIPQMLEDKARKWSETELIKAAQVEASATAAVFR